MTAGAEAGGVDLSCAFPDELHDPGLLARYARLLSDVEAARGARFHFARDRHRHLVTRALARTVLGR